MNTEITAEATIYAPASGQGRAGICVIRISGPMAGPVVEKLTGVLPVPRRARLCTLCDPATGAVLDRGLVLWFPAPHSFTGEDVVELHVHGGLAVIQDMLAVLGSFSGCRLAEPGEFSRRAFDHGCLDLSEIEGLADLIAAETSAQRRQAIRQMQGGLSRQAEIWIGQLARALAFLEAAIDFPDEGLPDDITRQIQADVATVYEGIKGELGHGPAGERLRAGVHFVILGPPNVGKSSLINALARRDVAIVSEIAGTTRDLIEVHLDLAGMAVIVSDTAGLREVQEAEYSVEQEGIRRALKRAEQADAAILMDSALVDAPFAWVEDRKLPSIRLYALNKCDLAEAAVDAVVDGKFIGLSLKTGQGFENFLAAVQKAASELADGGNAGLITRARHRQSFVDCAEALGRFVEGSEQSPELAAEDLRLAVRALGRISGRVDVEDLLDTIFKEFCIGK